MILTGFLITLQMVDFMSELCDTHVLSQLQSFVRQKAFENILNTHENAIEDLELGDLISKLIKLPSVVTSVFEQMKNFMLPNVVMHVVAIVVFFSIDTVLGTVLLLTVCLIYLVVVRAPPKCAHLAIDRDQAFGRLYEEIDDVLRNLFSVYGANKKNDEIRRVKHFEDAYNNKYRKTMRCSFWQRSRLTPVTVMFVILFSLRIYSLLSGKGAVSKAEQLVPCFFISLYLLQSFVSVDDQLKYLIFDWGMMLSCASLLNKRLPAPAPSNVNNQFLPSGIGGRNIWFKHDVSDRWILKGANFHAQSGDVIAVTGGIGSGKSTLLKILLGYYVPTSGEMFIDGSLYDDVPLHIIRRRVGYVPQNPILLNRTIAENIAYGNERTVDDSTIKDWLQKANLLKEFMKMPDGIHSNIGKNGSLLSGGQKQLLWCLRVFMTDPPVLIMDEPTSSIDASSKQVLMSLIHQFMSRPGKIVIFVSHDADIIRFANKRVLVRDNVVMEV
jgi:ABC-type multidrug transport system fused ATPase/permease subunit